MSRAWDRGSLALLACGAVAALLYANFLLDWDSDGLVGTDDIVSQLEAEGQPHAMLLRTTDVVCAALVVALLPWVRAALRPGFWRELTVWATVAFAVGATIAAIVPTPCGPGISCPGPEWQIQVHDKSSIFSDTALYVGVAAAWFATRHRGPMWVRRAAWWVFWVGGVVSSLLYALVDAYDESSPAPGLAQRLHILCISAWILCLAVVAARGRSSTPVRPVKEDDHAHSR
jgi:hypothetical protein